MSPGFFYFLRSALKPGPGAIPPACAAPAGADAYCSFRYFSKRQKSAGAADAAPAGFIYAVVSVLGRFPSYSAVARYRKVTTWPLVQVPSGTKVVAVMPLVTLPATAQATAFS